MAKPTTEDAESSPSPKSPPMTKSSGRKHVNLGGLPLKDQLRELMLAGYARQSRPTAGFYMACYAREGYISGGRMVMYTNDGSTVYPERFRRNTIRALAVDCADEEDPIRSHEQCATVVVYQKATDTFMVRIFLDEDALRWDPNPGTLEDRIKEARSW